MKHLITLMLGACCMLMICCTEDTQVTQGDIEIGSRSNCEGCPTISAQKFNPPENPDCCFWNVTVTNNLSCDYYVVLDNATIVNPNLPGTLVPPGGTIELITPVTCCGDNLEVRVYYLSSTGTKITCATQVLSCCPAPECSLEVYEFVNNPVWSEEEGCCLYGVTVHNESGVCDIRIVTSNGVDNIHPPTEDRTDFTVSLCCDDPSTFPGWYKVYQICDGVEELCAEGVFTECQQCVEDCKERCSDLGSIPPFDKEVQVMFGTLIRTCESSYVSICEDMDVMIRNDSNCSDQELEDAWNDRFSDEINLVDVSTYISCVNQVIHSISGCESGVFDLEIINGIGTYSLEVCDTCPIDKLRLRESGVNFEAGTCSIVEDERQSSALSLTPPCNPCE